MPLRLPPLLFSHNELGARTQKGENSSRRGEKNLTWSRIRRGRGWGSGASQPAATMRRASKKSLSSAATASAGTAPTAGPLPSSLSSLIALTSSQAVRMGSCFSRLDAGVISSGRSVLERTRLVNISIVEFGIWELCIVFFVIGRMWR